MCYTEYVVVLGAARLRPTSLIFRFLGGHMLRFLANVIWFIFGGLWLALAWAFAGLILCVTVVGIPLGLQCFKAARLCLAPFGKKVELNYSKHPIANVIWAVLAGWELALLYLCAGIANCITVVGIPSGIQCFKMMKLAFFPFGAKIS